MKDLNKLAPVVWEGNAIWYGAQSTVSGFYTHLIMVFG